MMPQEPEAAWGYRLQVIVWPESHIQTRSHQPRNAYLGARLP